MDDNELRALAHRVRDRVESSVDVDVALNDVVAGSRTNRGPTRKWIALGGAAAAAVLVVAAIGLVTRDDNEMVRSSGPAAVDTSTDTATPGTEVTTTTSLLDETDPAPSEVASTPVPPVEVAEPALVFDAAGNPLIFDDGIDAERSAFGEVLRDYLVNRSDILGNSVEEREQQLDAGGLQIHTTLDPDAQVAAETAATRLPANATGIDTAIVSLETSTGAVRAMIGAPRSGVPTMAVAPRQTGSAVGFFIIAAAVEAGIQADDQIDARRGCQFPTEPPDDSGFVINGGVAGFVGSVLQVATLSVLCGTARLSHILGLDNVVDTIYDMASSAYLDPDDASGDRAPLQPFASLATGANEMSALDMASGMQTVANEGVHHAPYFVEYIDDLDGNRLYTHRMHGTRQLEREASLATIDILKGVIEFGTGRRHPLADDRTAFGVTGTQENNTNAWFVGATPELTTSVWVGDPSAYTPMIAIAEFQDDDIVRVQGGTYPAEIWKAFTDAALDGTPPTDWAAPPSPTRPAARLVLPGVECTTGEPTDDPATTNTPQQIEPGTPITTVDISTDVVPC